MLSVFLILRFMKRYILLLLIFFLLISVNNISRAQSSAIFLNNDTDWVDSVMSVMSNQQKISQLFMVAAYSNKGEAHKKKITELINKYHIGGLMFLQGGPVRQAKLTNYYQANSDIPLMIAIDAEWGVAMRLDSSLRFPWQMTLGAIQDSNLIYQMGVEVARQCKLLGVNINFAPVIDINSNPDNPIINNRSFGEDPQRVASFGLAYMRGMQDNNVLACAKHFPGHGDTDTDSHKTLPVINHTLDRLFKIELFPFQKLINNGLGSVMSAHLSIPSLDARENLPTSLSKEVVSGLLKDKLGFTGLAITDALNMKGVTNFYQPGLLDLEALLAGNDVLLFSTDVPIAIQEIERAIINNKITQKEIDERCRKILMAKKWMGLDKYKPVKIQSISDNIISKRNILLDKLLVNKSLTLLQNYDNLLPLERLDTLKIASLSIGESNNINLFQKTLSDYAPVKHYSISSDASINEQAILLDNLLEYNLVIVSVHNSNKTAWESYKISRNIDILLQSIALQNKTILSIFSNPYSINSFLFVNNFDAFLLCYQNSGVAQKQAAQSIFGGTDLSGILPVSTKHFDIKSGIQTSKIRMGYVDYSEVNIQDSLPYKIDSVVSAAINNKAIPGCQVLIARDGSIFFNKSYGYHTYEKKQKVSNSDIYDLASITKIAATLPILMRMVDNNDIDLYDNLGNHFDFNIGNKSDLVLRDILAHQSGLKAWIPFYKETLVKDSVSGLLSLRDTLYSNVESSIFPHKVADSIYLHFSYPDSIMRKIYDSELLENKEYCYSDLGYYIFKKIIEDSYGESLDDILDSEFYKKLGMENLGYNPLERIHTSRIVPTENDFFFRSQLLKGHVHDMGAALQDGVGGHAGLFSNANDLAKIMQMYLDMGVYAGERYLSEDVVREFTKCQYCDNNNRRGAGFDKPALENEEGGPTCKCVSHLSFGHTGFTGTLAWADPKTKVIFIFLSNRIHPDADNLQLLEMNVRTEIMEIIFNSINE